jgi:hypothetical protein
VELRKTLKGRWAKVLNRSRWKTSAATACLYLTLHGGQSAIAEEIHYFKDEHGVAHFSNVPSDPRYRLLLPSSVASGLTRKDNSTVVTLFAPATVEQGRSFEVRVIFSSTAPVNGWLEIGFDPDAFALLKAPIEDPPIARVRLPVSSDQTSFSTDLQFLAIPGAPEKATIELVQTSLSTVDGRSVTPSVSNALPITIPIL